MPLRAGFYELIYEAADALLPHRGRFVGIFEDQRVIIATSGSSASDEARRFSAIFRRRISATATSSDKSGR